MFTQPLRIAAASKSLSARTLPDFFRLQLGIVPRYIAGVDGYVSLELIRILVRGMAKRHTALQRRGHLNVYALLSGRRVYDCCQVFDQAICF